MANAFATFHQRLVGKGKPNKVASPAGEGVKVMVN